MTKKIPTIDVRLLELDTEIGLINRTISFPFPKLARCSQNSKILKGPTEFYDNGNRNSDRCQIWSAGGVQAQYPRIRVKREI